MKKKCLVVGVILLFIGLAFAPSINARMNNEPIPDLDCVGGLHWIGEDLEPGDSLTGDFTVGNIGEPHSELDWQIVSCPFWGTWTFDPESGTGLTPEDGFLTVDVELILEVEINETLYGEIGIQNVENESDICYIDIQIKKKSSDDELVEFDVEFCGLGKKHTVQLTQKEADEVDLLFDDIEQRLSEVETREEAEEIFKDAVVDLDKYGLLGGLSVKHTQRLVTRKYTPIRESNQILSSNHSNFLCLVAGRTNNTIFFSPTLQVQLFFYQFQSYGLPPLYNILYCIYRPLMWLSYVEYLSDATGWLFSFGLNGFQFSNGNLFGKIITWFITEFDPDYAGVSGFTGIKLLLNKYEINPHNYFYLGTAFRVDVDVI